MTTEQEKKLTEELREMLDDNSNYKSAYTGTPMFFSEIAIPKIIAILKAKNISFNLPVSGQLPHQEEFIKWMLEEEHTELYELFKTTLR